MHTLSLSVHKLGELESLQNQLLLSRRWLPLSGNTNALPRTLMTSAPISVHKVDISPSTVLSLVIFQFLQYIFTNFLSVILTLLLNSIFFIYLHQHYFLQTLQDGSGSLVFLFIGSQAVTIYCMVFPRSQTSHKWWNSAPQNYWANCRWTASILLSGKEGCIIAL